MMMKNSNKLIIKLPPIISLYILCMPKFISRNQCCETSYCNNNYSTPIEFPFAVIDDQLESCGCQGFDLYCDNELGLLLEFPDIGNFTVDYISYTSKELKLSDPNECLAKKLLNLDLITTPFRGISKIADHRVYNCSGLEYPNKSYSKIDCLSGSDYTIISNASSFSTITNYSNCIFLKQITVPTTYDFYNLSDISSILLTWDEQDCTTCVSGKSNNGSIYRKILAVFVATIVPIILIIIIIIYYCRRQSRPRPPTSYDAIRAALQASVNENPNRNNAPASSGLDQITIDSYPIMILEEHDSLTIKLDKEPCSICLSEYSPKETVKMLPHCLHRFHANCIDMWLKSQTTCPVCRTSPA